MVFGGKGFGGKPGWLPSNTKVPPGYDPSEEASYSFRDWIQDIQLWCMSTDVPALQQAPLVVLQLGGLARELAREVPAQVLQNGMVARPAGWAGSRTADRRLSTFAWARQEVCAAHRREHDSEHDDSCGIQAQAWGTH